MKTEILRCNNCELYTLKESCPICGLKTNNPKPAKFSIEDKYEKYRRIYKEERRLN